MTVSIVVDDNNIIQTIYNGTKDGAEWIVLDREIPEPNQDNVAVTYIYDAPTQTIRLDVEPIPDDTIV